MKIKFHPRGKPPAKLIKRLINEAIEDIRTEGDLEIDDELLSDLNDSIKIVKSRDPKADLSYILFHLNPETTHGSSEMIWKETPLSEVDPDDLRKLYKYLDNRVNNPLEDEELDEEKERGDFIFPPDHFPINTIGRARNALSRASQYSSAPPWYKGSLESLVKTVQRRVKSKYPSIDTTEKSAKPGKN